jgi:hypothetical protein
MASTRSRYALVRARPDSSKDCPGMSCLVAAFPRASASVNTVPRVRGNIGKCFTFVVFSSCVEVLGERGDDQIRDVDAWV